MEVYSSCGLVKTVDICNIKYEVQIAQHNAVITPPCSGPISPPLVGSLDKPMTEIRTMAYRASSVQMGSIPAIPSPPMVLFNSQQMAYTGMHQLLQLDSHQREAAAVPTTVVHFPPSGRYGFSQQPTPNAQLSSAYGQQSLFIKHHQGQDIYSSNQYIVPPPYPQSQHVSASQVLNTQQNLTNSPLLSSHLVPQRSAAGLSPEAVIVQSEHSLQVQSTAQTSYFSTSAQAQSTVTPGSAMQQQLPQFALHCGYNSQSVLNVSSEAAGVTQSFRNYGAYQYKAAGAVLNNIIPESSISFGTISHSPDTSVSRNSFSVSTMTTTTVNSGSDSSLASPRLNTNSGSKSSQYSLLQSQQHYYPFGQRKFRQSAVQHPQALFPSVVRSGQHQKQPLAAATATNVHYPNSIQRGGMLPDVMKPATTSQQPLQQQEVEEMESKMISMLVPHSISSNSKAEQFRKYLENAGVLEVITGALIDLYMKDEDQPDDPLAYFKQSLTVNLPDVLELESLKHEVTEQATEIEKLKLENKSLLRQLAEKKRNEKSE